MKKILMSVALVSFLGATAVMANTGDDKKKKEKSEKCEKKKSCCKKSSTCSKSEKTEKKAE
jgi:Ni/Co efflux regulator RcnB